MSDEKRDLKINQTRMQSGDFVRNLWVVTAEQGTTKEDILTPSYWSHVASQFRPYDRIEVRVDDGTYFAELLILSCDRTWAKVKELSFNSLTTSDVSQTQASEEMAEFDIQWKGPVNKWSVIRKSDDAVIKNKMEKEEAGKFLIGYKKTIEA